MNNQKTKINKKQIIILIIILLIIIFLIFGFILLIKKIFSKEIVVGNMSNLGLVAQDKNVVFYNKYDQGIVKIKANEEHHITNEPAYSMTVIGDTIYYLSVTSGSDTLIRCVKTNGDALTTLKTISTSITKFYIKDNYLYYATNENSLGISKLSLENGNETLIVSSNVQDFVLDDNQIFFTDNVGYLRTVSLENNEIKDISREYNIKKMQILKNWIYFYDEDENALCKIKEDGTSKTVVTTLVNNEIYNITNKYIYYFDMINKKICRCNLKGKKNTEIVSLQSARTRINIVDGNIYYLDSSTNENRIDQMYRVKVNGKPTDAINYDDN